MLKYEIVYMWHNSYWWSVGNCHKNMSFQPLWVNHIYTITRLLYTFSLVVDRDLLEDRHTNDVKSTSDQVSRLVFLFSCPHGMRKTIKIYATYTEEFATNDQSLHFIRSLKWEKLTSFFIWNSSKQCIKNVIVSFIWILPWKTILKIKILKLKYHYNIKKLINLVCPNRLKELILDVFF